MAIVGIDLGELGKKFFYVLRCAGILLAITLSAKKIRESMTYTGVEVRAPGREARREYRTEYRRELRK